MRSMLLLLVMTFGCLAFGAETKSIDPFDGATVFYHDIIDYQVEGNAIAANDCDPNQETDTDLLNFDCSKYALENEFQKDSFHARFEIICATPNERINSWIDGEKIDGVISSLTTVTCFGVQK